MTKRPRDNSVGPWAAEKLEALRRGLDYYTTYLKNVDYWQKIYIDAFAGPGLSRVRQRKDQFEQLPATADLFADATGKDDPAEEEIIYLKGSPRVALDLRNPFDVYLFIERDAKRILELEAMRAEYGDRRRIEILRGDANDMIVNVLRARFDVRTHRAYAFLDPFGLQMPWSTIQRIAETRAIEVMINFPMGTTIRRMIPNSTNIPAEWLSSLDIFFGSPEWKQYAIEETTDLAGVRREKFIDLEKRLLDWYRARLKGAFGFVSEAKLITNTRGGRLYYLIWAGPRAEGLKGANYILTMKSRNRRERKLK